MDKVSLEESEMGCNSPVAAIINVNTLTPTRSETVPNILVDTTKAPCLSGSGSDY